MLWGVYLYLHYLTCAYTWENCFVPEHKNHFLPTPIPSVYRYKSFSQSDVKYLVNWYRNHNRFAFLRSALGCSCWYMHIYVCYMLVRNNLSCHLSRETYLYTFSYLAVICLHIGWKANTIDCRPICATEVQFWVSCCAGIMGMNGKLRTAKHIMFKWRCRLCITCADDFVRKIYDNIVL